MSLFTELRRRNVFRVATAYLVVGWLLVEVSTTLLPTFGAPDWVARALILLFAIAFIPVIVFSWAFELTPEGIKREKDVDRDASITGETGKKLNYVTIAAVVIGVAFLAWDKTGNRIAPPADEVVVTTGTPSVAVLPFVNMSGNAENEYFSDGLTETLLHMLAQIPELRVAARTSSFAFKGDEIDIREIAGALNVAHVLEGSVQRSGDRVRITAQLIRAQDGFHVWSENFDRTLDDIFAIQDEIAGRVGDALSASLLGQGSPTPVAGVGTENLEAYDLYLRALAEHSKGSYGSLKRAEGLLKDALSLDPGFLDAKTELADGYVQQWMTGLIGDISGLSDSIAMADQVLTERPGDVNATTVLYFAEIWDFSLSGDSVAAMDSLDALTAHAHEHANDVKARMYAAAAMARFNRSEDALAMLQELEAIDPLNPTIHYELAVTYRTLERWSEQRAAAERSLELEPINPNAQTAVAWAYLNEGNGVEFLRNYILAMEIDPKDHELPGHIAKFLYDIGLPGEADSFRSRVLAIAPSSPVAYVLNRLHALGLGDLQVARAAARAEIEDDVDNRLDAYTGAVAFLVSDAIENDTVDETLRYLEGAVPGIANFESTPDLKYLLVRFSVLNLWHLVLPEEEARRRYEVMWEFAQGFGFNPEKRPLTRAIRRALDGPTDATSQVLADEYFNEPLVRNLYWRQQLRMPVLADAVRSPLVQEGMRRYEREEEKVRAEVLTFMEEQRR